MSLREEQCKKICRILDDVLANRPTERDSLIVAVQLAFESLSEPHWIPVKKRLPKEGGDVLYCDIDEYIYMGHRYANTWWSDCEKVKNVTAWMPLPEPCKGVTE